MSDGLNDRYGPYKNPFFYFFEKKFFSLKTSKFPKFEKNFFSNFGSKVGAMDSPGGPLLGTEKNFENRPTNKVTGGQKVKFWGIFPPS